MAEHAGFSRFLIETFHHLRIAGKSLGDGLDRHFAIELAIKSAINETHPAATEKIDHLVLADALYVRGCHGNSRLSGLSGTQGRSGFAAGGFWSASPWLRPLDDTAQNIFALGRTIRPNHVELIVQ